jgi:hypothetical protein
MSRATLRSPQHNAKPVEGQYLRKLLNGLRFRTTRAAAVKELGRPA